MEWLNITAAMYRQCFTRAASLTIRNWPVFGSIVAYWALMTTLGFVLSASGLLYGPTALVGGLFYSLARAACFGSFLYLVEVLIRSGRVTLDDFRLSFTVYLWDVIGVMFLLWIILTFATPVLGALQQGWVYVAFLHFVLFVVLNAVPELIYLGHHSSLALFSESYAFIGANWIEWFLANIAAAGAMFAAYVAIAALGVQLVADAVLALLAYFVMVMRGLLFEELYGSSYRSRAFRYRSGG